MIIALTQSLIIHLFSFIYRYSIIYISKEGNVTFIPILNNKYIGRHYAPLKFAFLFSKNAEAPSLASSLAIHSPNFVYSASKPLATWS